MREQKKILLPALFAAVLLIAWIGVDFSPGFSESFTAFFITAQVIVLLLRNPIGRLTALAGSLLLAVGSYVYAAGDDHLNACVWAALVGAALCAVLQLKKSVSFTEFLLRTAIFGTALFTLFCGIFSTALLPPGAGAMLCFAARYAESEKSRLILAGTLLCCLFLLAPMCFPGGGPL